MLVLLPDLCMFECGVKKEKWRGISLKQRPLGPSRSSAAMGTKHSELGLTLHPENSILHSSWSLLPVVLQELLIMFMFESTGMRADE